MRSILMLVLAIVVAAGQAGVLIWFRRRLKRIKDGLYNEG